MCTAAMGNLFHALLKQIKQTLVPRRLRRLRFTSRFRALRNIFSENFHLLIMVCVTYVKKRRR